MLDRTPGAELFVEAVRSVGAESGIPVVRRAELMRQWVVAGAVTPSQLVGRDGLHMTDAGYALLAVAIAEQMQAEASARSSPVTELARDGRNAGPEGSA